MTPARRKWMRQQGLSDLEISRIEGFGLAPVLEMMFGGMLSQARTKTKTKAKIRPWWRDLGLEARPASRAEARTAYSQALLKAHPDHGGSMPAMVKVKAAWDQAQQEFENRCSRES